LILKQIPGEKRKDERKLWKEFEEVKPRIFGAILDTLSKAMQIYPTLEIEHLPRMADFAMWGEAVARALGYKPSDFLDAYFENIGEQVREILEQNPIGLAIMAFIEDRAEWEGTPGELLKELEDEAFVKAHNIDVNDDNWPKSANWVTRRIKEIETNLEHEGVKIATKRVKGRRVITLTKTEKFGRDVSGNGQGDGSDGDDSISPTKNVANGDVQHRLDDVGSQKVSRRNTVTALMPSPCALEGRASVQEAVEYAFEMMAKRLPNKTIGDAFLHDLKWKGKLTDEEAKKLLDKLIDDGLVGYDKDGWLGVSR